jgi:hypothetical protein
MTSLVCKGHAFWYVGGSAPAPVLDAYVVDVDDETAQQIITGAADPWDHRSLAAAQELRKAACNAAAAVSRAKFVTAINGQDMVYMTKLAEARDAQVVLDLGQTLDPADYPILAAEATATGQTLTAVVGLVLTTAAQWTQVAAQIEGARRGAIVAIEAATDVATVDAVTWTFP